MQIIDRMGNELGTLKTEMLGDYVPPKPQTYFEKVKEYQNLSDDQLEHEVLEVEKQMMDVN